MTEEQKEPETKEQMEARIVASAGVAGPDTEARLADLLDRKNEITVPAERKADYEELRDALTPQLLREGPRYFVDHQGVKRVAYAVQPEPVDVYVRGLEALVAAGKLTEADLDKVAPRKPDKEVFRRYLSTGKIEPSDALKVASISKGTAYVKFVTLDLDDD